MFENPWRGRQARNFTTNIPKILDRKSSSEQIFPENCCWVPLLNYSPDKSISRSNRRPQTFSTSWKWKGSLPFFAPKVRWFPVRPTVRSIFTCEKVSSIQSDAANGVFSLAKVHRSHRWLHWLRLNTERCFHRAIYSTICSDLVFLLY